jgi:hypothetical protein
MNLLRILPLTPPVNRRVVAITSILAGPSYTPDHQGRSPPFLDKQEVTMTTMTRLIALALVTASCMTAPLLAGIASAHAPGNQLNQSGFGGTSAKGGFSSDFHSFGNRSFTSPLPHIPSQPSKPLKGRT